MEVNFWTTLISFIETQALGITFGALVTLVISLIARRTDKWWAHKYRVDEKLDEEARILYRKYVIPLIASLREY